MSYFLGERSIGCGAQSRANVEVKKRTKMVNGEAPDVARDDNLRVKAIRFA